MTRDDKIERTLKKTDRLLATFRSSIGEVVPVQIAHTFILVARNEGLGVQDLADRAGTNKSTMSRHLLDLSGTLRSGAEGYGLLNRTQDPSNLRSVFYTLTPKGKLLINQLVEILED